MRAVALSACHTIPTNKLDAFDGGGFIKSKPPIYAPIACECGSTLVLSFVVCVWIARSMTEII